jgi:outer membrane protein assembly factor BamD (BamD/ComL family)
VQGNGPKLKNKIRYMIFLMPVLMLSCAYFNMYYNAKESYNDAEKKRKETNVIDKSLYENSLKELSKILEFYPESRWVDDALLMMGLCYLRQGEFYKAQRKFNELVSKFPDSELNDQAKIHWAEAEIGLKNYDAARELISQIRTQDLKIEPYELLKLNAEMSLSAGDSAKALSIYIEAYESAKSPTAKNLMLKTSAELSEALGDHKNSAMLYEKLVISETERKKKFESLIKYSEALDRSGKGDEAVKVLESETKKEEYQPYALQGFVKLASFYLKQRSEEKVYEILDEVLRTNPKDRNNGELLSEAAYYFGEYWFDLKKEMKPAETMYDSAGFYDRKNIYFQKANSRVNLIRSIRNLKEKTETAPARKDSLVAKIERLERKSKVPGIVPEALKSLESDIINAKNQLKSLKTNTVNDKMKLAEIMYHEVGEKDTAKVLFKELAEEKEFPHKASMAMLRIVFSEGDGAGDLEDSILSKYPYTASANFVRSKRGLEPVEIIEDSARYLFNISSQKFIDSLYTEAYDEYFDMGIKFEKSPLAPKILNAAGLIAENYLKDFEKAAKAYEILKEKYSATPQGRFASLKLQKEGEKPAIQKEPEQKLSDSEVWYLMDRRNE